MAPDVVEMALIPRPPKGGEEAPVQSLQMQGLVSSLCEAVHSYRQNLHGRPRVPGEVLRHHPEVGYLVSSQMTCTLARSEAGCGCVYPM